MSDDQAVPLPDGARESLGRLVRETWVAWAREQPDPKPSWLTGWDELDEGQREVDMRIGEAVRAQGAAAERERLRQRGLEHWRKQHASPGYLPRWFDDLLEGDADVH